MINNEFPLPLPDADANADALWTSSVSAAMVVKDIPLKYGIKGFDPYLYLHIYDYLYQFHPFLSDFGWEWTIKRVFRFAVFDTQEKLSTKQRWLDNPHVGARWICARYWRAINYIGICLHVGTLLLKGTLKPDHCSRFSGHCAVATRFVLCGTRSGRACTQKGLWNVCQMSSKLQKACTTLGKTAWLFIRLKNQNPPPTTSAPKCQNSGSQCG